MFRMLLLAAPLLLLSGPAHTDEPPSPQEILEKALKAHGGEKALQAFPAASIKAKGTFYGLGGEGIPYTGEFYLQGNKQFRFELQMTIDNQAFTYIQVLNGDKGWVKIGPQQTQELKGDKLQEEQVQRHEGWVARLYPLKDKAYKLATLGEVKVEDRPALGFRVSKKGQRDVNLFFDKKDGLLLKSEVVVKNVDAGGKEQTQETFFRDYKDLDGIKYAMRVAIHRDGKLYVEAEYTEIKGLKELPAAQFEQP